MKPLACLLLALGATAACEDPPGKRPDAGNLGNLPSGQVNPPCKVLEEQGLGMLPFGYLNYRACAEQDGVRMELVLVSRGTGPTEEPVTRAQTVARACKPGRSWMAGDLVRVELPACGEDAGRAPSPLAFRFDRWREELVPVQPTPRVDGAIVAQVKAALDRGDFASASGMLELFGAGLGSEDLTRELHVLALEAAHREASARLERGDPAGAAAVAAWLLSLPEMSRAGTCPARQLCVSGHVFPFEPGTVARFKDLASILAKARPDLPHPDMKRGAAGSAKLILEAITQLAPNDEAAWLQLGDAAFDVTGDGDTAKLEAKLAYRRWWELARPLGKKMPARVKGLLSPADGGL